MLDQTRAMTNSLSMCLITMINTIYLFTGIHQVYITYILYLVNVSVPPNYLTGIYSHMKLCIADAIHNFKRVKIIHFFTKLRSTISKWCRLMSSYKGRLWYNSHDTISELFNSTHIYIINSPADDKRVTLNINISFCGRRWGQDCSGFTMCTICFDIHSIVHTAIPHYACSWNQHCIILSIIYYAVIITYM